MKKYVFTAWNSEYKLFFVSERKRLRSALGGSARIQHVGSTSIPGLGGKGILDIVVGVPTGKVDKMKQRLVENGYLFREKASTTDRLFFRRDYPDDDSLRRVHVHLTAYRSTDWHEMVSFRDYLLRRPEAVEEYVLVKRKAVAKARGKGDVYRKHKERFIKNILRKVEL